MTLDADHIVDRRRLRRKLSFWRVAAFLLAVAALLAVLTATGAGVIERRGAHVARIELSGMIVESRRHIEMLDRIRRSGSVRALIVTINSPGGTTAGAEALYDAIRKVGANKPVVAQMGTLATSGGYAAAIAADHVVARQNTITGSIGVLVQWADATDLLESIGVDVQSVKSSPLKAAPSPFEPTTDEARQAIGALVLDSYDWFVDLVAERRGLSGAEAQSIADGRIMTGRQALAAGLVDALGGEDEALDWLAETRGIDRGLPVRDWRPSSSGLGGPLTVGGAAAWLARVSGLEGLARSIEHTMAVGGLGLDGLVSVWHPQVIEE